MTPGIIDQPQIFHSWPGRLSWWRPLEKCILVLFRVLFILFIYFDLFQPCIWLGCGTESPDLCQEDWSVDLLLWQRLIIYYMPMSERCRFPCLSAWPLAWGALWGSILFPYLLAMPKKSAEALLWVFISISIIVVVLLFVINPEQIGLRCCFSSVVYGMRVNKLKLKPDKLGIHISVRKSGSGLVFSLWWEPQLLWKSWTAPMGGFLAVPHGSFQTKAGEHIYKIWQ